MNRAEKTRRREMAEGYAKISVYEQAKRDRELPEEEREDFVLVEEHLPTTAALEKYGAVSWNSAFWTIMPNDAEEWCKLTDFTTHEGEHGLPHGHYDGIYNIFPNELHRVKALVDLHDAQQNKPKTREVSKNEAYLSLWGIAEARHNPDHVDYTVYDVEGGVSAVVADGITLEEIEAIDPDDIIEHVSPDEGDIAEAELFSCPHCNKTVAGFSAGEGEERLAAPIIRIDRKDGKLVVTAIE